MIKRYDIHLKSDSGKPLEQRENYAPNVKIEEMQPAINNEKSSSAVGKMVAIQFGKQALNYTFNSFGDLTGNYIMQETASEYLELISLGAMALSSPAGAVAATLSIGVKGLNKWVETNKKNQEVYFLRERTGLYNERSR